ncbi:MAG TPA: hypothetical protein VNJ51_08400 [Candidatus Dormibacteraeota bacterium]|nr:hypothetical protein [Candidatus Dormibacteraeota bacterium]
MSRAVLRISAFAVLAVAQLLLHPASLQADAAAPIGLQWDEVGQILMGQQPVPAVGTFDQQVAELRQELGRGGAAAPAPAAAAAPEASAVPTASPTPAPPKHRGLFGDIVGAVTGRIGAPTPAHEETPAPEGSGEGSSAGASPQAGAPRIPGLPDLSHLGLGPAMFKTWTRRAILTRGHHWERVDDLKSQTAVITKCDERQIIYLDLAKKTYRTVSMDAGEAPAPPAARRPAVPSMPSVPSSGHPPVPQQIAGSGEGPGQGTVAFAVTTKSLGAATVAGQRTSGYDTTMRFTAKGTGSCPNGGYAMTRVVYQTSFDTPRLECPLPRRPVEAVAPPPPAARPQRTPSCKVTYSSSTSGPKVDERRFAMYQRMSASGGKSPQQFAFVEQRGNLKWLSDSPADLAIFEVPPGFTKVK